MAEYKLSYTAQEIDEKLGKIDELVAVDNEILSAAKAYADSKGGYVGYKTLKFDGDTTNKTTIIGIEAVKFSDDYLDLNTVQSLTMHTRDGITGEDYFNIDATYTKEELETFSDAGIFVLMADNTLVLISSPSDVVDYGVEKGLYVVITTNSNENVSLITYASEMLVNAIDPKYIPYIQADYAQNDPTQPDYVKNRLAYDNSTSIEILPETVIYVNGSGAYFHNEIIVLKDRSNYTVIWDGTEYNCECIAISSDGATAFVVGNLSIVGLGNNTLEPFCLGYLPNNHLFTINTNSGTGNHTVNIIEHQEDIRKIDPKYYERLAWVDTAQTEIFPETTIAPFEGEWKQEGNIGLQEGHGYIVNWNGVEYKCVCSKFNAGDMTGNILGNLSILGVGSITPEPFIIVDSIDNNDDNARFFGIASMDACNSLTVSIAEFTESVHKIDEKFLPEVTWDDVAIQKIELFNDTVSGFTDGAYSLDPAPFELEEGKEYEVVWDGMSYTVTAIISTYIIAPLGSIAIGNTTVINPNNKENTQPPFVIAFKDNILYFIACYVDDGGGLAVDVKDSHDIVIKTEGIIPINLEYIPSVVPKIQSAEVGQVIVVKAIDENGKPIEWEAVDLKTLIAEILAESTTNDN